MVPSHLHDGTNTVTWKKVMRTCMEDTYLCPPPKEILGEKRRFSVGKVPWAEAQGHDKVKLGGSCSFQAR